MLTLILPFLAHASTATACTQPDVWATASDFDLAANGLLPASYPQLPASGPRTIPPSLLKAVGWVESGWRQFDTEDRPLVSFDFGYGIMQITSGMSGAYGDPAGDIDPIMQSQIASDAQYNIAYGAMMLASKWNATPAVGNRDPASVEDWYYALWAYNGWGWQNNPNNPRFTRQGTPATNPASFPYQERVLYFVSHPPRDAAGNMLWAPVPVTLPSRSTIGKHPATLTLRQTHRQPPATLSAIYKPGQAVPLSSGAAETLPISLRNTGTATWQTSGPTRTMLSYTLISASTDSHDAKPAVAPHGIVRLPRPILPGQWSTLKARVTAPSVPGAYTILWDLRQADGVAFSRRGVTPGLEPLRVTETGSSSSPTPTPAPTATTPAEGLRYVADTSVPNGTVMTPEQTFSRGWLVFNDGKRRWQAGWSLVRVKGTAMGASRITVPTTPPCRTANLLVTGQAPTKPRIYRAWWQLEDPQGHRVGDVLTLVVIVRPKTPATPTATPLAGTPTPTVSVPTPTATPIG